MKTMKNKKSIVKFVVTTVAWLLLFSGAFTWLGYYIGFNIGSDKAPVIEYEYVGDDLVRFVDDEIEGILSLEDKYTAFIVWDWFDEEWDNVLGITGITEDYDILIFVKGINKRVIWHEYIHAWDMLIYGGTVYDYYGEELTYEVFDDIVDLTEAQTNYLAYLLLLEYGYTKDAHILFNDMISRSDAYGYLQLLEDGKEEIDSLFDVEFK